MKKTSLVKNTMLLTIGTAMIKGINLLMIPLFSAWLSTEDYGTFDLICTYVSLLIPFITLSNSDAIFRFVVEQEDISEKSRYITSGFIINLVNIGIVGCILIFIQIISGWKMAFPFLILLITEIFNNHLQGFMRATKQLNIYSFSSVVTTIGIALSVPILILYFNLGLRGIILGYAIGNLIGELFVIIITKYCGYLDFRKFSFGTVKELVKYSYALIPNNISWWIINVSDRTLINIFIGAAANGIYAIAYKIPNFCASIFNMFSISWQEAAIVLVDTEERNDYYNLVYNNTISTMISLCGGLITLNYFLFNYIFDIRYFDARLYSPILITSVIFGSLTQYFGGIQISLKRPKENGITTIIGAVVNIVINLFLIKIIGLYAAALSTLIANVSVSLIRYIRLGDVIRFKIYNKTWVHIVYYLYLLIMSYTCSNFEMSCLNLILTCIMFVIINKEYIIKFLVKFKIIKSR